MRIGTIYHPHVPRKPFPLMKGIYNVIFPVVHKELSKWKKKAEAIPNQELRKQALASIETKQFHCEGGGIYALLAEPEQRDRVSQFIVAYQTISDYLDNLCDRSHSMAGDNFRLLHQALVDALTLPVKEEKQAGKSHVPREALPNYYALQEDQDDGGYLHELVRTCQQALEGLPSLLDYQENMLVLCQLYCDLQVYKHIELDKREAALKEWWRVHQADYPELEWYEFAAASGSTLGIFYYIALASMPNDSEGLDRKVISAYFPYVQGLHILLDYLIDQEEDRQGGDLNFCFYYSSDEHKLERFSWFAQQARDAVQVLPQAAFHQMIVEGLLGLYLADQKVREQEDVLHISRKLLKRRKPSTWFFFLNGWLIHRKGKKV